MGNFRQGYYHPKNPEKYVGEISKIFFRSSWEKSFMGWADNHPSVLKWGSEVIIIPYIKPTDHKQHRYFVDFYLEYRDKNGKIVKECIEIKPNSQKNKPRKRRGSTNLYEEVTYAINVAKWKAASKWCKERGILFRIVTEKELFR